MCLDCLNVKLLALKYNTRLCVSHSDFRPGGGGVERMKRRLRSGRAGSFVFGVPTLHFMRPTVAALEEPSLTGGLLSGSGREVQRVAVWRACSWLSGGDRPGFGSKRRVVGYLRPWPSSGGHWAGALTAFCSARFKEQSALLTAALHTPSGFCSNHFAIKFFVFHFFHFSPRRE